jgi:cysteinyl-tRNA synthetase
MVSLLTGVMLCLPSPAICKRADLSWVQSWAIQLQNADIDSLVDATYDVVVIDYARDGSETSEYTFEEIEHVRNSGKLVLAYLSIGEAEDYRFYWKRKWTEAMPFFMGPENPHWPGNYLVRYWTSSWWNKALRPYLDRILAAGFDGVYLDLVDAYWWWYAYGGMPVRQSANRMARTIRRIAEYARKYAGEEFVVCGQNGISLLNDASTRWCKNYIADIDAVGMESLFYNIWSREDQAYRLSLLKTVSDAGKKIFNVEYIDGSLLDAYFETLDTVPLDILGYPAGPDRALDELILY